LYSLTKKRQNLAKQTKKLSRYREVGPDFFLRLFVTRFKLPAYLARNYLHQLEPACLCASGLDQGAREIIPTVHFHPMK